MATTAKAWSVASTDSTAPRQAAGAELLLQDDFTDDRDAGHVVGTRTVSGQERLGCDVEGVLSIDNGALRIAPLVDCGFGRAALVYGPFDARPGFAYAVYMLNGHNTAQAEPLPDTFFQRVALWFKGSQLEGRVERLQRVLSSGRLPRILRQFKRWKRAEKGGRPVPLLDENLAIGLFPTKDPIDPREAGNPFVMHALGPENGELRIGAGSHRTRALRSVQNVPLYYVAVVRAEGTVYYIASLEGAIGPGSYPRLRPVGIDRSPASDQVFLGIHQSVLGQIGWRLDSRVHGVRVAEIAGFEKWYGGAHAADPLSEGRPSNPFGGQWELHRECSLDGSNISDPAVTIAVLDPVDASGLVHATVVAQGAAREPVGLVWRFQDSRNYWRLTIQGETCEMGVVVGGKFHSLASRLCPDHMSDLRLQILDDGQRCVAHVDGEPLTESYVVDARMGSVTKVGILYSSTSDADSSMRRFEAHPRNVKIPEPLDMGAPWRRLGEKTVIEDDFSGDANDLHGRKTTVGAAVWTRILGEGVFETTGTGAARVKASPQKKCPTRTLYCVDWAHPDFVDIEVTITPPGTGMGQRNLTTAGFVLYQDPDNYVTLNCYRGDYYPAGSVSTFFRFNGYEDVYDAIWANIGDRVYYGRPLRLRLCCDGERYLVFINEEAVLYRTFRDVYPDLPPLRLHKVGLLANWEFGTDTGSLFEHCVIRA